MTRVRDGAADARPMQRSGFGRPEGIRKRSLALAAASLIGLAACASTPNPTGEMATARAAVENARRAGAGQLASSELNDAQQLLTTAERAHAGKDYEDARRAAELARVTAELAQERSRLAKAEQARTELERTLDALRSETTPQPAGSR